MKIRTVIISSRQLGSDCWLPIRFTGQCKQCPNYRPDRRYAKCTLPQPEQFRAGDALLFDMGEPLK